ncbi:helicase-associated [Pelagophyceae sp. CCMP2097]|nr:helicase-associated [Pelagophyceae sp. CCMP2097]
MRRSLGARRLATPVVAAAPQRHLSTYLSTGGWDANYQRLAAYRKAEGDCRVPQHFAAADGANLGHWVASQRQAYKAAKLSPERVRSLDAVSFVWRVFAAWDANYAHLKAYHEKFGDVVVPSDYVTADGTKLGEWVDTQRQARKTGKMRPVRLDKLEALSFVWTLHANSWDANFELLKGYHAAHGNCAVPDAFVTANGTKLGTWVHTQRQARNVGEMSQDRIARLQGVGFVWSVRGDLWDAHFELLLAYLAANGGCAVPDAFVTSNGIKLGSWVHAQRQARNAGDMSPERFERLEAVGFVWSVLADLWGANCELLRDYHAEHGSCTVPASFVAADGTKLGRWALAQRRAHRAGDLSPDRVERLDSVGFAWA